MRLKNDAVGIMVAAYVIVMFVIIFTTIFFIFNLNWNINLGRFFNS